MEPNLSEAARTATPPAASGSPTCWAGRPSHSHVPWTPAASKTGSPCFPGTACARESLKKKRQSAGACTAATPRRQSAGAARAVGPPSQAGKVPEPAGPPPAKQSGKRELQALPPQPPAKKTASASSPSGHNAGTAAEFRKTLADFANNVQTPRVIPKIPPDCVIDRNLVGKGRKGKPRPRQPRPSAESLRPWPERVRASTHTSSERAVQARLILLLCHSWVTFLRALKLNEEAWLPRRAPAAKGAPVSPLDDGCEALHAPLSPWRLVLDDLLLLGLRGGLGLRRLHRLLRLLGECRLQAGHLQHLLRFVAVARYSRTAWAAVERSSNWS